MSHRASLWAFDQRLDGWQSEKLVLLALADHADDDGECWPSFRRIAQRSSVSKATAVRAIRRLMTWGLIKRDLQFRSDGGRTSNLYIMQFEVVLVVPPEDEGACLTVSLGGGDDSRSDSAEGPVSEETGGLSHGETRGVVTPAMLTDDTSPSVTADTTRSTNLEPSKELTPNPQGGRVGEGDLDSVERKIPDHDQFFYHYGMQTAPKRHSSIEYSKLSDEEKLWAFEAVEAHKRACDTERRKRPDPARFLRLAIFKNFERVPVKAADIVDPPDRVPQKVVDEIRALARKTHNHSGSEFFVHRGSAAWNQWHKAYRLAELAPFHDVVLPPRPLAGRQHEWTGYYFPVPLPPTAPEEMRTASGDLLASLLRDPVAQPDENEESGEPDDASSVG